LNRSKFEKDVLWNVGGLAVAGIAGIALSAAIALGYTDSVLGSFNQVFAAYIFFSQFAVLGIHHSVLTHVAAAAEKDAATPIIRTGLATACVPATLFAGLFYASAGPISAMLESPAVATGIRYAAPGLFFFALNKVSLSAINGSRHMRAYALLTAGRFLFMLGFFGLALRGNLTGAELPAILSLAEGLTFVLSLAALRPLLVGAKRGPEKTAWVGRHIAFGLKGFLGGVVVELNTRVDVLMLGVFLSDAAVGMYSFAALVAEGLAQLLTVLRQNYSPILARLLASGDAIAARDTIIGGRNRVYPASALVGALAVLGYALGTSLVFSESGVAQSWPLFATLVAGLVIGSGYSPFSQILIVAGRPGWNTWMVLAILTTNALLNAFLIPAWGVHGAAVATAVSFGFAAVSLRFFARRLLDLRI